jgi:plastocyanin
MRIDLGSSSLAAGAATIILLAAWQLPARAADSYTIHLKTGPNRYDPSSQFLKAGDSVTWMVDAGTHTVTPNDGEPDPFPPSGTLNQGDSYGPIVISGAPRTIHYHCLVHGLAMSGQIVVTP